MKSQYGSAAAVVFVCAFLVFAATSTNAFASGSVSPDKQWEYQCVDGLWSQIVKPGSTQFVVDLSNEVSVPYCDEAEVVWTPDSKRFAFNYTPPHAPHTCYVTIALYQLRDDKWVALPSPVEESSDRAQLAQLAKEHLPKNAAQRRIWESSPNRDILKVREWTDANTAILYAYAAWDRRGARQLEASFLFTLKFDAEGNSKIIKARQMSKEEIEKEAAEKR
jgi:hypothetical protein